MRLLGAALEASRSGKGIWLGALLAQSFVAGKERFGFALPG